MDKVIKAKQLKCNDLGKGILFENGYALNRTAYIIWTTFKEPKSIKDGFIEFSKLFDVSDSQQVQDEFNECIRDMFEAQLVESIEG